MKPLSEQDHYEILEIDRNADLQGIERAYRMATATYAEDSLAGYSMVTEGDAEALRDRIEIAYHVLIDSGAREAYDASLDKDVESPTPTPPLLEMHSSPLPSVEDLEELDPIDSDDSSEFDGARLRRLRLRRGIEIEDVAGVTKINPNYLRFIEDDRFSDLPARVYVRGFVTAYAQCLGLDAKRVAASYMNHYEADGTGNHT